MKLLRTRLHIYLMLLSILSSCSLLSFDELYIKMYPEFHGQIIPVDSSLTISFSLAPEKELIESMVNLTDMHGNPVSGYVNWTRDKSDTIYHFTPYSPLQEGMKYELSLIGTVIVSDGRTFNVNNKINFYGGSRSDIPVIESFAPACGSIVSVSAPLTFTFSSPINTAIFEREFTINPSTKMVYDWNSEATSVTVRPETKWNNKNLHTWTMNTSIANQNGVHFARIYSGQFLVQEDIIPPVLSDINICSFNQSTNSFSKLPGLSIENDMTNSHHFLLNFNESVEANSIKCSISPDIDFYLIQQNSASFILKRTEDFLPDSEYELTIAKGITDLSGNETTEKYSYQLKPAIPSQSIQSIEIISNSNQSVIIPTESFNTETIHKIPGIQYLNDTTAKSIIMKISLKYPIGKYIARSRFIDSIKLRKIFPIDGSDGVPYIAQSIWSPENTELTLHLYDFAYSSTDYSYDYIYAICISSDKEACATNGSYLTEDITFQLKSIMP